VISAFNTIEFKKESEIDTLEDEKNGIEYQLLHARIEDMELTDKLTNDLKEKLKVIKPLKEELEKSELRVKNIEKTRKSLPSIKETKFPDGRSSARPEQKSFSRKAMDRPPCTIKACRRIPGGRKKSSFIACQAGCRSHR
jgi:hypothetical protein